MQNFAVGLIRPGPYHEYTLEASFILRSDSTQ